MIPIILCAAMAAAPGTSGEQAQVTVSSVAIRVHHTEAMLKFYSEAFGIEMEAVDLPGLTIYEGSLDELRFKFVPIRENAEFEAFPILQLGFTVIDLEKVIRIVERHGGRVLEKRPSSADGPAHVAIRDPDGNSIELYSSESAP